MWLTDLVGSDAATPKDALIQALICVVGTVFWLWVLSG